jgi:succinate dehydrogenase/fumarate reductase flavoprotein subunit
VSVDWDLEADVVVVGSGGAGLTAAILAHDHGARAVVLERSDKVGGTTAVSGGGAWVPLNHHMAETGASDSREEALAYCKTLTAGRAPDELVETFVDTAHVMARYLEEHTPLCFQPWSMPDYHLGVAGAKRGGRSLEPSPFDKRQLGEWAAKLRPAPLFPAPLTLQETTFTYQATVRPQNVPGDVVKERVAQGLLTSGAALVAALLKGCLDRGIDIVLEARGRELAMEDGCVVGLRAERARAEVAVKANGGVVLASGGFEWSERLKSQFLPGPVSHPNSPPFNEGDGLIMAIEAGAALANMTEVWGSPVGAIPDERYEGRQLSRLVVPERACPHSILVNRSGQRFVNEGATYNELGRAFNDIDPNTNGYANLPCWAIFDAQYREKYPALTLLPGQPDPDWLLRDDTIEGLAHSIGADPAALRATVDRWNAFVTEGVDRDFERHRSPMDIAAPHASMGTIEQPPFYALPVYQGTLGTKGGPQTNAKGQVLNVRGAAIPGLYAAGNVMASVAGPAYYGGGAPIALAMTWGYICGINAAQTANTAASERGVPTVG